MEQRSDHAGGAKVSEEELQLADALFDVQVAKVEAPVVGGEKAEFPACILTDAEFGEDDRGHGFLDIFQLAGAEVANGKTVSDAAKKDAEIVNPRVVVFAGTCGEQAGVHAS